jgi:N-methylhydantoinase A
VAGAELLVGIDIGGTFTDFVVIDGGSGRMTFDKVLTTPDDPSRAVIEGLRRLELPHERIGRVIHGTTLATNAIIQRTGARTALVTTRGFRDVLEIRREKRFDIHDVDIALPPPLVPRPHRFEVDERIGADGGVVAALKADSVVAVADALTAEGIESVAVVLLNSFVNPDHEHRVARLLAARLPGVFVSLSSEINPEIREYERTSTTVVNAYVQPLIRRYLESLERELQALGYAGRLYLMLSDGGVATADVAAGEPVRIIESGPAGGAVAAALVGGVAGFENLIAFDMGGTTAKICLIEDGKPARSPESEIARVEWSKRGSGFPLRAPGIEMIEIGTGGGSLAALGGAGILQVGPRSAGADPGPACYGRGGLQATVTDADLVLGLLGATSFLGGRMQLDVTAARRAIDECIGAPLGASTVEAAWAIHDLANEQMGISARLHVVQRGQDPGEYVLCAFGGAGPVHAARIAERLGITRVLYPPGAGVASALGFLAAPPSISLTRGYATLLRHADVDRLAALFDEMGGQAVQLLRQAEVAPEEITFSCYGALCYDGQGFEVETPLAEGFRDAADLIALEGTFHALCEQLYGRSDPELDVKALSWRLVATGRRPAIAFGEEVAREPRAARAQTAREVYFPESGGFVECPVHDRTDLRAGDVVAGPAIVEEAESTVVLTPAMQATVVRGGSLLAVVERPVSELPKE